MEQSGDRVLPLTLLLPRVPEVVSFPFTVVLHRPAIRKSDNRHTDPGDAVESLGDAVESPGDAVESLGDAVESPREMTS